jgi:hypothetical protein
MTLGFPHGIRKMCFDALQNVILPLSFGCGCKSFFHASIQPSADGSRFWLIVYGDWAVRNDSWLWLVHALFGTTARHNIGNISVTLRWTKWWIWYLMYGSHTTTLNCQTPNVLFMSQLCLQLVIIPSFAVGSNLFTFRL